MERYNSLYCEEENSIDNLPNEVVSILQKAHITPLYVYDGIQGYIVGLGKITLNKKVLNLLLSIPTFRYIRALQDGGALNRKQLNNKMSNQGFIELENGTLHI